MQSVDYDNAFVESLVPQLGEAAKAVERLLGILSQGNSSTHQPITTPKTD